MTRHGFARAAALAAALAAPSVGLAYFPPTIGIPPVTGTGTPPDPFTPPNTGGLGEPEEPEPPPGRSRDGSWVPPVRPADALRASVPGPPSFRPGPRPRCTDCPAAGRIVEAGRTCAPDLGDARPTRLARPPGPPPLATLPIFPPVPGRSGSKE